MQAGCGPRAAGKVPAAHCFTRRHTSSCLTSASVRDGTCRASTISRPRDFWTRSTNLSSSFNWKAETRRTRYAPHRCFPMGGLSIWHLLILAVLLLLLFGGNRFSSMMGDVAKGLKSFKQGMADEDEDKMRRYDEQRRNAPPRQLPRDEVRPQEPIDVTPRRDEPVAPPPPPRDDETR